MEEELASQMETIYSYCVVDSDSGIYFSRGVHFLLAPMDFGGCGCGATDVPCRVPKFLDE